MTVSSKLLISFLLLLFPVALFSAQIHARESHFFSKIPSSNGNSNVQETVTVPAKEDQSLNKQEQDTRKITTLNYHENQQQQQQSMGKRQQQDPTFIPETQNEYGLYGHENGDQFPATTSTAAKYEPYTTPTTATTESYEPYTTPINSNYEPYTTPITSTAENYEPYTTPTRTQESYNNYPNNNNNNNYYTKNAFGTELGDSKFQENTRYNTLSNQNNNNNYYYSSNNGFNGKQQGMSDTRFLENGKYYYDVNNEQQNNNYYPNQYQNSNEYNARGSYYDNNSMEGNQNQEEQYEFDELQD